MPELKVGLVNGKSCPEFDTDFLVNQNSHAWGSNGEAFVVLYHSEIYEDGNAFIVAQDSTRAAIARQAIDTNTHSVVYMSNDGNKFPGADPNNITVNGILGASGNVGGIVGATGNTLRWELVHMRRGSGLNYSARTAIQVSGRGQVANDRDFEGYIAEILMFNSPLSDIRRRQIQAHLKAKWAIDF
jgi:hypothetical protein